MRGKAGIRRSFRGKFRITPAYAGKRASNRISQPAREDHPRLCGEKSTIRHVSNNEIGSPPPMRGKEGAFCLTIDAVGITPAYAGKSTFWNFSNPESADHPRLCGEKVARRRITQFRFGITPAYAGKSIFAP